MTGPAAGLTGPAATPAEAQAAEPQLKTPWKARADGTTVFRREAPFIFFWIWIAFVIFNVVQVVVPDHDYFSVELIVALLGLTGVGYACGFRPRVIASPDAVVVRNPLRDHSIQWGALTGITLGESVELRCSRPEPRKEKTVYCWALYAGRSARRRKSGGGVFGSMRGQQAATARLPAEIRELEAKDPVEQMCGELASKLDQARQRGVPAAVLQSRTPWLPVASIAVPAVALAALLLAR